MEDWKMKIDVISSGILSALSWLLGSFNMILLVLLIVMITDIITGMLCSKTSLNSQTMFDGLKKKCMIVIFVMCANMLDIMLGKGEVFRTLVITFYIANELLSIVENGAKLGLPVPKKWIDCLEQLKEENDKT